MIFLRFIYQIAIKFWIRNSLLQKFHQNDMTSFYQFIGKRFAEFMIPIALLKSLAVKNLLRLLKTLTCEDALVKRKFVYKHHKRDAILCSSAPGFFYHVESKKF